MFHHGAKAALINANDPEYFYKSFIETNPCYARVYVHWSANPANNNWFYLFFMNQAGIVSSNRILVRVFNDAGTIKWRFLVLKSDSSFETITYASPNPTINTWYCVECKWTGNTLAGASFWVDGVLLGSCTGTTYDSGVGYLTCVAYQGITGNNYYDCVVVDSAYIGPEAAGGPTVKKGSCVPAMMALLTKFTALKQPQEPKFQPRIFPKFTPRRLI